ncbi:MAG: hypothetical protein RBT80_07265 [Candidatus Vecturithrix sp.]|jgi:hypothetical protein|nr:hypothetical protein [Candidatus Vecturithrix sp.]
MATTVLTNVQRELLTLYATNLNDDDLRTLKFLLARFFAQRAIQEADRVWDERNLSQADMEAWLNES